MAERCIVDPMPDADGKAIGGREVAAGHAEGIRAEGKEAILGMLAVAESPKFKISVKAKTAS